MNAIHASRSEQDTFDAGVRIGAALRPGDMVLLEGELGAGKTSMVRGIAEALGIERRAVSSPTFTIVHEHGFEGGTMYHIDAYRLSGVEELEAVGWEALNLFALPLLACVASVMWMIHRRARSAV